MPGSTLQSLFIKLSRCKIPGFMNFSGYIVLLLAAAWTVQGQTPTAADTLQSSADSAAVQPAPVLVPRPVIPQAEWYTPAEQAVFSREELREEIFEDSAELLSHVPGSMIFRGGDAGLPALLSYAADPARFTRLRLDGLDWPVGLYGQTGMTPVPETAIDGIALQGPFDILQLRSQWPDMRRMLVISEYVRGPYGGDGLRLRFSRKFSPRLDAYWGGTIAENDGQAEVESRGPYTGDRVYGRMRYAFGAGRELRYRYLKSRNETTAGAAWTFDELRTSGAFLRKESRSMHALEFAATAAQDSSETAPTRDLWSLRLFSWDVREELREKAEQLFVRNRLLRSGVQGERVFPGRDWQTSLRARFEWQRFYGPAIDTGGDLYDSELTAGADRNLGSETRLSAVGSLRRRSRFGNYGEARLSLTRTIAGIFNAYAATARESRVPEPGEYANAIAGVLAGNDSLNPMGRTYSELGLTGEGKRLRLVARVRHGRLYDEFILSPVDTVVMFTNSPQARTFTTASLFFELGSQWGGRVLIQADGRVQKASEYLYWYQPRYSGRVEASLSRTVFGGDLGFDVLVRGRVFGDRSVPVFERGGLPEILAYQPVYFLDAELRLYFRDAMLFVNVQNILQTQAEWRPGYPMRPFYLRTGVYWALWD